MIPLTEPGGVIERRIAAVTVAKESHKFSAAHFTIFSATERENLHGHNFKVCCSIKAPVGTDGMTFDYRLLKRAVQDNCDELDERLILAGRSPHLKLEEAGGSVMVTVPPAFLELLNLRPGASIGMTVSEGRLILEPRPSPKYTLSELLDQCDPSVETDDDAREWLDAEPVGNELL